MRGNALFLSTLLFMAACGCDAPPPPAPMPATVSLSADVVTDHGRGTYDWRVDSKGYILRPEESDAKR